MCAALGYRQPSIITPRKEAAGKFKPAWFPWTAQGRFHRDSHPTLRSNTPRGGEEKHTFQRLKSLFLTWVALLAAIGRSARRTEIGAFFTAVVR